MPRSADFLEVRSASEIFLAPNTGDFRLAKAAIFDLDGTLLDSVDLHAIAWHEAMLQFGHDVSFEQARSQIGKGGDKLIPVFLSAGEQRDHCKDLEEWRGKRFKSKYLPLDGCPGQVRSDLEHG